MRAASRAAGGCPGIVPMQIDERSILVPGEKGSLAMKA
jgi:hypothetical protein